MELVEYNKKLEDFLKEVVLGDIVLLTDTRSRKNKVGFFVRCNVETKIPVITLSKSNPHENIEEHCLGISGIRYYNIESSTYELKPPIQSIRESHFIGIRYNQFEILRKYCDKKENH